MQPDLNNLKAKIKANRDFIDRIASSLPGFKGYVEKSENYDADKIIRGFVTDKIITAKKNLGVISGDNVRNGNLGVTQEFDSLSLLLEGLLKKAEFADYGVSGGFSKISITEEDQNRLLEYDWRLITAFDEIYKLSADLSSLQGDALTNGIKDIKTKIREFEKNFDDRKYVIMEVI
ncbi:MAG TPA: hypothetical protein PKG60_12930 [Spirochaetota bacterium]|nr:hypothetical protein [Spirochaetota bacterium]HPS85658.1 hypothetical protein [Spirochaetota bacterium]